MCAGRSRSSSPKSSFAVGLTAGLVRQASFKALREDKDPREIVREVRLRRESSSETLRRSARAPQPKASAMKAPQTSVKLTHPDRVLWPEAGVTKQALADYYALAWPFIAPHIVGRPLALVRCPAASSQGCFFQKHQMEGAGDYIVASRRSGGRKSLVGIDDFDGLIALVQASVLEIHPWGAKVERSRDARPADLRS